MPSTDVTQILSQIERGDPNAAEQLLPLAYDELRKLAASKLASEKPGQTLQATALVHESYLRLVDQAKELHWNSRDHFFAAAAESMRRILVEKARRKKRFKHGGDLKREPIDDIPILLPKTHEDLVALDAALKRLEAVDPQAVQLVHQCYFAGFSNAGAARLLGVSPRTGDRIWAFTRAWLHQEISGEDPEADLEKK